MRMGKGLNTLPYYALTGFTSKMRVSTRRVARRNCVPTEAFGQIKQQYFTAYMQCGSDWCHRGLDTT